MHFSSWFFFTNRTASRRVRASAIYAATRPPNGPTFERSDTEPALEFDPEKSTQIKLTLYLFQLN